MEGDVTVRLSAKNTIFVSSCTFFSFGANSQLWLETLCIICWENTDVMCLTVQGVIVLHWVGCSDTEGPSGWVCYREQVVDTCCGRPPMLTFLIMSTSLSSKTLLWIREFPSFWLQEKAGWWGEPEEVLLSDFYSSSSLKNSICQDEYYKRVCFVGIKWDKSEGSRRIKWKGRTWGKLCNERYGEKEYMMKSPLSFYSNERDRSVIWEDRKRENDGKRLGPHKTCSQLMLALNLEGTLSHTVR